MTYDSSTALALRASRSKNYSTQNALSHAYGVAWSEHDDRKRKLTVHSSVPMRSSFLPRDARSASAVLLSQIVCPSVCP